jgi:hypothetical protein
MKPTEFPPFKAPSREQNKRGTGIESLMKKGT